MPLVQFCFPTPTLQGLDSRGGSNSGLQISGAVAGQNSEPHWQNTARKVPLAAAIPRNPCRSEEEEEEEEGKN